MTGPLPSGTRIATIYWRDSGTITGHAKLDTTHGFRYQIAWDSPTFARRQPATMQRCQFFLEPEPENPTTNK